MHGVHVDDLVHGSGQHHVGLLLPVLQVFLRAAGGAARPQSRDQPRQQQQRRPAGAQRPPGAHVQHADVDVALEKVHFFFPEIKLWCVQNSPRERV